MTSKFYRNPISNLLAKIELCSACCVGYSYKTFLENTSVYLAFVPFSHLISHAEGTAKSEEKHNICTMYKKPIQLIIMEDYLMLHAVLLEPMHSIWDEKSNSRNPISFVTSDLLFEFMQIPLC